MAQKDLHDVIIDVLTGAGKPLSVKNIQAVIETNSLWLRPKDGLHPAVEQISARVNNYSHLFLRENSLVSLTQRPKDTRLLRITWNENRWEYPSGHKWKKENQGNKNIAHENQYGYGGEEWLFNPRYNIGGYQYGYIRGLWEITTVNRVDEVFLFTINQKTKDRFLVGKIENVELLDIEDYPRGVLAKYRSYGSEMIDELKGVQADYRSFQPENFHPFVRFKLDDLTVFSEPILANELKKTRSYNRFKPYHVDSDIYELLTSKFSEPPFVFRPGKRKNANANHTKKTQEKTVTIEGLHAKIQDALEEFLKPDYAIAANNISIEKTVFGNNIADIVLKERDGSHTILEVKTSHNTRYNIREALGQLLDYALWQVIKVKRLIIVAPSLISEEEKKYFKRIQSTIKVKLEYWQYRDTANVKEKFIKTL